MIKTYASLFFITSMFFSIQANLEKEKKYIISGSYKSQTIVEDVPGSIFVCDTENQKIITKFQTYNQTTCAGLAYFEYEQAMRILTRLWDKTIVIYNLDGSIFKTFTPPISENVSDDSSFFPTVVNILRSDDNLHILVGYRCGKIAVWDVNTGEHRYFQGNQFEEKSYGITAFSLFSDNGTTKVVAASCDGSVCVYDFQTGEKLKTFTGFKNWVTSVALFKDNTGFNVVAGGQDRTIQCWNIESGQQKYSIKTLDHYSEGAQILPQSGEVEGLVLFKNDSKIFLAAIASNLDVVIYNAQSGVWVKSLVGHTNYVTDLRVYQDQESNRTKLVSASYDATVRLWDFESGEQEHLFDQAELGARNLCLFYDSNNHLSCAVALASMDEETFGALGFIDLKNKTNSVKGYIDAWMQAIASCDQNFEPKSYQALSPNVPIGSYIGMDNLANIQVIDVSSSKQ